MKQYQLQELIRHITQRVLKEISAPVSSGGRDEAETNSANDGVPVDQLSPAEISKMRRDKEVQRRGQVKQKEKELEVAKKEMDFQKQKVDQTKRFAVPNITKDIQRLKGAKMEEDSPSRMPADKDPNIVPSPGAPTKVVEKIFGDHWEFHKTQAVDKNWVHSFVDYTGRDKRSLFICLKDMELYYAFSGDREWQKHNKSSLR